MPPPEPPTFARGQHPLEFPAYLYPGGTFALDGIATRASGLGFACALFLNLALYMRGSYFALPLFGVALSVFHFLEFWTTAKYNTRRAKIDAFILTNNGSGYTAAHASATLEALIEWWLFPSLKRHWYIMTSGIVLMLLGQAIRSLAMAHAGANFSHYLARRREDDHVLVQSGIYKYLRHPSYFGFWWWSIGTQLMLCNPVCLLGYAGVLWVFFSKRVEQEEEYLVAFFGNDYLKYREKSWVGIPFIK